MALGRCCICQTYAGVTNIVMLDRRGPDPGQSYGWGCVVCGLPNDGAVAVLCDGCLAFVEAGADPIYVCRGYPAEDRRIFFHDLSPEPFGHNEETHLREEARLN